MSYNFTMSKSIFITGTGTDVGKTFVSALILKELTKLNVNCAYYKPVLSGAILENGVLHAGDCEYVINFAGLNQQPLNSAGYVFEDAVSPHLAARNQGVTIDKDKILNEFRAIRGDYLLVEGAGGITCPLSLEPSTYLMSDLVKDLGLEIVVVADASLGTINSTLLTLEYAKSKDLKIKGVILNRFIKNNLMHNDNLKTIEKLSGVSVLGIVEENSNAITWLLNNVLALF